MTRNPQAGHRPSFLQRESYRQAITEAYADGRLDDDTFAERIRAVDGARSLARLEALITDLPRQGIPVPEGMPTPGNEAKSDGTPVSDGTPEADGKSAEAEPPWAGKHGAAPRFVPEGRRRASSPEDDRSAPDGGAPGRRPLRRRLAVASAMVACLVVGFAAGGIGMTLATGTQDDPAAEAGEAPDGEAGRAAARGALADGFLSYGYLHGLLTALDGRSVGRVVVTDASAEAMVARGSDSGAGDSGAGGAGSGGSDFDPVGFDEELHEVDPAAPLPWLPEGKRPGFDTGDMSAQTVFAAVSRAPEVLGRHTDRSTEGLQVSSLTLVKDPTAGRPVGGSADEVRIQVELRRIPGSDPQGPAGGMLVWNTDGSQLLEARFL
jgi:hypothetical protein